MNGKRVASILENPNTRTVVESNKASYRWALDPEYQDIMSCYSPPSLKELKSPDVKDYVEEFYSFGSEEPTENIIKVTKLLQHWTAGQHGVGTWHGAGPVMAQKIMLQRAVDFEHEKNLVKATLKLKPKKVKPAIRVCLELNQKPGRREGLNA